MCMKPPHPTVQSSGIVTTTSVPPSRWALYDQLPTHGLGSMAGPAALRRVGSDHRCRPLPSWPRVGGLGGHVRGAPCGGVPGDEPLSSVSAPARPRRYRLRQPGDDRRRGFRDASGQETDGCETPLDAAVYLRCGDRKSARRCERREDRRSCAIPHNRPPEGRRHGLSRVTMFSTGGRRSVNRDNHNSR